MAKQRARNTDTARANIKSKNGPFTKTAPRATVPEKEKYHNSEESQIEEQWRLIEESGIFLKVRTSSRSRSSSSGFISNLKYILKQIQGGRDEEPVSDEDRDYITEAFFLSFLIACLFVFVDGLVQHRFGGECNPTIIMQNLCMVFPVILLPVYLTNKLKAYMAAQVAMLLVAILCTGYFIHVMLQTPSLAVMKYTPITITVLIYCFVHLLPIVLS